MRFVDIESSAVTEVIGRRAFRSRADIREFLDNIPTANVKEVVHGTWLEGNLIHRYGCSCCGVRQDKATPYCPNCGSTMIVTEVK